MNIGDKVKVIGDRLPAQAAKGRTLLGSKKGQTGTVAMILSDGLVVIDISTDQALSCWPDELRVIEDKK